MSVSVDRQADYGALSQRVRQTAHRLTSEECSVGGGVSSAIRRTLGALHRRSLFTAEHQCNATSKSRHVPQHTMTGRTGSRLQVPDFVPLMSLQA